MTTRAKLGVAACASGLLLVMPITLRQMSDGQANTGAAPEKRVTPPEAPTVRIEHQFVTVELPPPPVGEAPARVERPAPVRRAARPASPTLSDKAKRALLGDGRYRPEPFPRAR